MAKVMAKLSQAANGRLSVEAIRIMVAIGAAALTAWIYWDSQVDGIRTALATIKADVQEIKGNRFKAEDGLAAWKEMGHLQSQISALPKEGPPQWLLDRLDRMEAKLDRLQQHIEENGRS
jgi:hypothetical protein